MSQTETPETAPQPVPAPSEEQIRKIYVKDLKNGDPIHTVFKCVKKERHSSRGGRPFLSVVLCDRTGTIDARIFENVETAETVFALNDYLLVQGRVGAFHGKPQLVIDALERLDPEPIEAAEFMWSGPIESPKEVREPKEPKDVRPKPARDDDDGVSHKAARARLLKLLDNPQLALALDAVVRHFEHYIDERIAAKLSPGAAVERERPDKRPRPRVEVRPEPGQAKHHEKYEPKRDPSLPEGLSFKPLDALVGENSLPKP